MLRTRVLLVCALLVTPSACGKKRAQPGGIPPSAPTELTTPDGTAPEDEQDGDAKPAATPHDLGEDEDGDFDSAPAPKSSAPKAAPSGAPPKWAEDAAKKIAAHVKGKRSA